MTEFDYDPSTRMLCGFPPIRKLGAVSGSGESSPFFRGGRAYRLELCDPSRGTDAKAVTRALIRDRETGEILSRFGEGCYYYSLFAEPDGDVLVLGTVSLPGKLCGETVRLFRSSDLVHWTARDLFTRPGWQYYNTSLARGPEGYVLLLEAGAPAEEVGLRPFTFFFAASPDLERWTFWDRSRSFSQERYMGGPWMTFCRGFYYVISVTELPCRRYSNYLYRTADFRDWQVGLYVPLLSPDERDRAIAPGADLTPEQRAAIPAGMLTSSSDMDLCETPDGRTLITYNVGNQLGFYYLCEAVCDRPLADFLENNFR